MPKRQKSAPRTPTTSREASIAEWSVTDEWGMYDPAKAGMQALYARLGRPVLRASSKTVKKERRRAAVPERTNEGVGLAIEEAMLRAGVMDAKAAPVAAVPPAKAVRQVLKSLISPAAAEEVPALEKESAKRVQQTAARKPRGMKAEIAAAADAIASAKAAASEPATRKTRKPRVATAHRAAPAVTAPPVPPPPPAPPAPSPQRPRGPVPLAAWAHAAHETPKAPARPTDAQGFWKRLFRIPVDVALVEYAHGCRIQRLLIETSEESPVLDLL